MCHLHQFLKRIRPCWKIRRQRQHQQQIRGLGSQSGASAHHKNTKAKQITMWGSSLLHLVSGIMPLPYDCLVFNPANFRTLPKQPKIQAIWFVLLCLIQPRHKPVDGFWTQHAKFGTKIHPNAHYQICSLKVWQLYVNFYEYITVGPVIIEFR